MFDANGYGAVQGRSATSMQWGAWGGTGMAVAHNLLPRIIKSGLGVLPPADGVAALAAVLRQSAAPPAQVVISPFDWSKLMAGADRVFPVSRPALPTSHRSFFAVVHRHFNSEVGVSTPIELCDDPLVYAHA